MSADHLGAGLDGLTRVTVLGQDRLPPGVLARTEAVGGKARERLDRGEDAVLVAVCGGTGVGKSSLVNALVGTDVAAVGLTRPTTAVAQAVVFGAEPAGALLDWVDIRRRHQVPTGALPEGAVLVDVPDHDADQPSHHAISRALIERVDVLVWVVDPLKYAAAGLHHEQLAGLAEHAEVVIVALNHADRLDAAARPEVLTDLRRLLTADGLADVRTLATSARTGDGVDDLRALLADEVTSRRAARRRLAADVRAVARETAATLGPADDHDPDGHAVVAALAAATGVESTVRAAAVSYHAEARHGTSSLVTRPLGQGLRLLRRPLSRWLRPGGVRRAARADQQALGATPTGVQRAVRGVLDEVGAPLPDPWRAHLEQVVGAADGRLMTRARGAVDAVELYPAVRRWWRPAAALATIADLVALTGGLWLALLGLLSYLRLPEPPPPMVTEVLSWPTALLLGGLLARAVIVVLLRVVRGTGARRHARRVRAALTAAITEVVDTDVVAPLRAEQGRHARLASLLADLGAAEALSTGA